MSVIDNISVKGISIIDNMSITGIYIIDKIYALDKGIYFIDNI